MTRGAPIFKRNVLFHFASESPRNSASRLALTAIFFAPTTSAGRRRRRCGEFTRPNAACCIGHAHRGQHDTPIERTTKYFHSHSGSLPPHFLSVGPFQSNRPYQSLEARAQRVVLRASTE